jgi:FAD/FMN-containing dehydrogenase
MNHPLISDFGGTIHRPGEPGYHEQRAALSPDVDSHPVLVAEATTAADVSAVVRYAAGQGLPLAVQATGHGTWAVADDGILLRTTSMTGMVIDADRRIARVGSGTRWGQVLDAAAQVGLAPLAGSSRAVGVTGYTLGGGVGWLARKYGFAADSVLRAQVVTADGRIITADREHHAELWWALRGGGGSFGIVTGLEFQLYPMAEVFAGIAYFPRERAGDILNHYRTWAAAAPDELSTAVVLTQVPDGEPHAGERAVAIKVMYAGSADAAGTELGPLWKVAGTPWASSLGHQPFAQATMGGTAARHLDLFEKLPDAVIDSALAAGADATVEIRHWGGAMARPHADAGPVGHRSTQFTVIVDNPQPDLAGALRPHATGGSFLNFLSDTTRTRAAYTDENYQALRRVKATYDPHDMFRIGHRIEVESERVTTLASA